MNIKLITSTLLVSLFMLAACSTVPNTAQVADSHVESDLDHSKIQKINRTNQSHGIQTLWVNPPRKRAEDSDDGN